MQRFVAVFFGLLLAVVATGSVTASELQPIPSLTGPVIDLTNTLSTNQQQQLSDKLISFHQKYGAQMQVLIISTSAPEDAFSYSMRVVDKWKLGTAEKDNGLLLFIAKNDHRSQIQVGYGLEGAIPDVIAHRLLNDVMAPYFKQGDFYSGINAVIDGVYARISGDVTLSSQSDSQKLIKDDLQGFYIVAIVVLGFIAIKIAKSLIGGLAASIAGGPIVFFLIWFFVGLSLLTILNIVCLVLVLAWLPNDVWLLLLSRNRYGGGGFGGGGGGWSGGGGGFGGGGSGGRW